MRYITIVLILLWNMGNAQTNQVRDLGAEGLQVGQIVPSITVHNVHNYLQDTLNISDFKGKLLILDFWATWCAPCIGMLPKMDELQMHFKDKIQVLPVTYQSGEDVMPFIQKLYDNLGKEIILPFVTGHKTLHQLFPHVLLPHYVWISPEGVVLGITGTEDVTVEKVKEVLQALGMS